MVRKIYFQAKSYLFNLRIRALATVANSCEWNGRLFIIPLEKATFPKAAFSAVTEKMFQNSGSDKSHKSK
jgi:hypothetical protein